MSQITRGWLAFAAIGAGVIHLALVINAPLPLAVVLGLLGIAEFGWGVMVLSRDRVVVPRLARAGAIVPMIAWSLMVVTATVLGAPFLASIFNFVPMAVASLFELFIAGYLSVQLRRDPQVDGGKTPKRAPAAGLYLIGMFAGALLVAALTTPALAYTQAGIDNPHAGHGGAGTTEETDYNFDLSGHAGH
ncbi:MAG: hypothetical protein JWO10_1092 [Microbacteriaceae bacterium]|nr:hypothetical protein [Microbacteriaceae bacterium]